MKIGKLFLLLVISQSVYASNRLYKPLAYDELYEQYSAQEDSSYKDYRYHEKIDSAQFLMMPVDNLNFGKKAESNKKQASFSVMQAHGSNSVDSDIMQLYTPSGSCKELSKELSPTERVRVAVDFTKKFFNAQNVDKNLPIGQSLESKSSVQPVEQCKNSNIAEISDPFKIKARLNFEELLSRKKNTLPVKKEKKSFWWCCGSNAAVINPGQSN